MQNEHVEKIDFLKSNLNLAIISEFLPLNIIKEFKENNPNKYRERLYSLEVILQAMLFQVLSEDKSEQNTVLFLSEHFKALREEYIKRENELEEQSSKEPKKRGRPVKTRIKIQKSKLSDISVNTASYNESKKRFPFELIKAIAENIEIPDTGVNLWHGHRVLIADGTNLDTFDNKELREYFMPDGVNAKASLPIVKIEGLIDMYSGMIVDILIDNYRSSESRMLRSLYRSIAPGSLLLGDDLYSSYSHLCFCRNQGCDIIAQGKHRRKDKIIRAISTNDAIVEWSIYKRPAWFTEDDELPRSMQVRRICYTDPNKPSKKLCIYTTLTDENKYKAIDIVALFSSRWDIEIGFREIKKLMNMEHLRGKSVDIVKKEVYSHWIVYNIIRKIMYKVFSEEDTNFFSLREKLQIEYTKYKDQSYNLDKLGRSYKRRSPGRYGSIIKKEDEKKAIK